MAWYDDLANAVGFSSQSLGINDQAAKDARAAQDAKDAEAARVAEQERLNKEYDQMANDNRNDQLNAQSAYEAKQAAQKTANDKAYGDYVSESGNSAISEPSLWDKFKSGATSVRQNILTNPVDAVTGFAQKNPQAAAALAGIGTAGLGYVASKGNYDAARQTTQDAANLAGQYVDLGQSQVGQIQDNTDLTNMQMGALQKIQQLANNGETPEDAAYRRQQENAVNQQYTARQHQADENNRRRGFQTGSGMAMAQAQSNNDAAQQNAANMADADLIRKQQAKTAAISNLANQSGTMQGQVFDRNLNRASAVDKFNTTNVSNKMNANVSKANLMGNVAAQDTQQGQNKANLATSIGNVAMAGITGKIGAQNNTNKPQQQ